MKYFRSLRKLKLLLSNPSSQKINPAYIFNYIHFFRSIFSDLFPSTPTRPYKINFEPKPAEYNTVNKCFVSE